MDRKAKIVEFLQDKNIKFEKDFLISKISYFKIGGTVPFFITPENIEQIVNLVKFLQTIEYPYKVIGNASNCLFKDSGIDKVIVSLKKFQKISTDENNNLVNVEAGVMLPLFVKTLSQKGKQGFEGLIGIPGTIGGAIFMNAGAYGNGICDNLIDISYLDRNGIIKIISKKETKFSFRYSIFQEFKDFIILSARFRLLNGNQKDIDEKIRLCQRDRNIYQETKYPNLGSLFKTRDIYEDIACQHKMYAYLLWFLRKTSKFYGRKNNRVINYFTIKYFNMNYGHEKPFSDKTLNCLVNRGNLTFKKAMVFIDMMKKILKNSVELEIEIVE